MEDPSTISSALMPYGLPKIERIGDHAKNIAEHTIYIVEGRDIRHSDYVEQTRTRNRSRIMSPIKLQFSPLKMNPRLVSW